MKILSVRNVKNRNLQFTINGNIRVENINRRGLERSYD